MTSKISEKLGILQMSPVAYASLNREVERMVQIVKHILQQEDLFLALLEYRVIPTSSTGVRPAKFVFG